MEPRGERRHRTPSLVDDMVESVLEEWSGLRLYLRQRRSGRPSDPILETLLRELLRVRFARADVPQMVAYLTEPRP